MKRTITTFAIFVALLIQCNAEIDLSDLEIPDIDDFTAIKEKCDRLGGNGTFDKLKKAQAQIGTCVHGLIDATTLKNEVEEAKKTGSMDEVFGKYCAKRPQFADCVQNLTDVIKLCLDDEEKKALKLTLDIGKQLGEFVCFRDGDRIAMFIAEGGVECIKDHTEGIKNCVNSTFKISTNFDTNSIPNLLMDKKKCNDLGKLSSCVVTELEKCKDSTPANIVEALFRFIKKSACVPEKSKRSIHAISQRSAKDFVQLSNLNAKIVKIIEEKCEKNADSKQLEKVKKSFNKFGKCHRSSKELRGEIFSHSLEDVKRALKECADDLMHEIEKCLSDNEKYFPQFQLDYFNSIIEFVYRKKDVISTANVRQQFFVCMKNLQQEIDGLNNCLTKTFKENEISFDKKAVCNGLKNDIECVTSYTDKFCTKEKTFNELKNDWSATVLAGCP